MNCTFKINKGENMRIYEELDNGTVYGFTPDEFNKKPKKRTIYDIIRSQKVTKLHTPW